MYSWHTSHLGVWLPIILIVAVLLAIFEVWMIVDAALNKKISDKSKTWWIIGMILLHPFVAIIYFLTDHKKRKA